MEHYYLAIDIGASSGRHLVGYTEGGELKTDEVYRFPNGVTEQDGHLVWDTEALFSHVLEGIRRAFDKYGRIESLAIDTWGVDYVLMRGEEAVLPTYAYRDNRTQEVIEKVHQLLPFSVLYEKTGIQFQPFNSIYQLYADQLAGRLEGVTDFLMIPEYLSYRLTGVKYHEYTNASTTGLLNAATGSYDAEILSCLGLPEALFTAPVQPGHAVGALKPEVAAAVGGQLTVLACASHDTASAVEGIPIEGDEPYISSGTWSLLGAKLQTPNTSEASRLANYSNEGGVGYIRYLKNIMGMWVINNLKRELAPEKSYDEVSEEAKRADFDGVVDLTDARFLAPTSMKEAFASCFSSEDGPKSNADYFRCAHRSLAYGYEKALGELASLTGRSYSRLYIVGGGAKNQYLNQLTEEICKIRVVALPIEATAIGNLKLQMEATTK